jgi:small subunit ribosomal protein S20
MPNTSSAKKALRGSLKKQKFNLLNKSKIKNALRDFRKAITTSPSEYQVTLSKAFSALDKAVKKNFIPKGRADRKKARLAAMASKANGVVSEPKAKVEKKSVEKKVVTKALKVAAPKKVVAEKATVKKTVTKPKTTAKKAEKSE